MGEPSSDQSDDDFGEDRDGEGEELDSGRLSRLGSNRDEGSQSENGYGHNSFEVHESQEKDELSPYEEFRRRNIERNYGCLQSLGLIKEPKPKVFVHNVMKQ